MTMLKNRNSALTMPKTARVMVAGPTGQNLAPLNGSWSYTWQGADESAYPESTLTIYEALVDKLGDENVVLAGAEGFENPVNYDARALPALADSVDYVVLALGERSYAESPGALDDLNLDPRQKALARAVAGRGKPVIFVLAQGRPRIIRDIEPLADGILLAYRPGSQGARAIADVLTGDHNPSGVLPFSYPQYTGDQLPYDHGVLASVQQLVPGNLTYEGYKPQWPFGHGLSYTKIEYENLELSDKTLAAGEELEVSVRVRNTGQRDGAHIVELYISDLYASLSPAARKLRAFEKVYLEAGKATTVRFKLGEDDLSFVNLDLQRVTEPGDFTVRVGPLTATFRYE